ncbi:MAG: hypothetical protein KTR28_04310 [Micavibrio sp.]|nr:hypothetical protein [Micavibrio sp.]
MKRLNKALLTSACILTLSSMSAIAQQSAPDSQQTATAQTPTDKTYTFNMRAIGATEGLAGKTPVKIWGIQPASIDNPIMLARARAALDKNISKAPINCVLKGRTPDAVIAQCLNYQDIDLGLAMLQQGHAVVDRTAIYDTIFESTYLDAEEMAQDTGAGIWGENQTKAESVGGSVMITLGFVLFLCIVIAFAVLSTLIMRGFQRVIDAQNRNLDLNTKERALRDKERQIFASMLDSEIKSNKSKIEAYIIVYEEMLKSLRDPNKQPKYQTSGDIVQAQPVLNRSVFDRNTDKLDVLGHQLSSDAIHFYARIKTNAEYVNIEPEFPLEEALSIVEKAISNAKRLNSISDRLIDAFAEAGLSAHNY